MHYGQVHHYLLDFFPQFIYVLSFGKPRMIPSPSSNLDCMTVFDMRLRLTFVIWLPAVYRFRQTYALVDAHTRLFSQSN
jgi:hypothetical protein